MQQMLAKKVIDRFFKRLNASTVLDMSNPIQTGVSKLRGYSSVEMLMVYVSNIPARPLKASYILYQLAAHKLKAL
jgi:hypothetical protein